MKDKSNDKKLLSRSLYFRNKVDLNEYENNRISNTTIYLFLLSMQTSKKKDCDYYNTLV
jgi:hypothetical protein